MTSLTVQSMSGRTISPLLKNKFTKKTNKQILGIFLETQADEKKKNDGVLFFTARFVYGKCQRVKRTRWQF